MKNNNIGKKPWLRTSPEVIEIIGQLRLEKMTDKEIEDEIALNHLAEILVKGFIALKRAEANQGHSSETFLSTEITGAGRTY